MNVFSHSDIEWLSSIKYNDKFIYELEIRIRINNYETYKKILSKFSNVKKIEYFEKNIIDNIIYKDKFRIIKREQNQNIECYTKKLLKTKYLDNIPGKLCLSSEQRYDIILFNKDTNNKVEKI